MIKTYKVIRVHPNGWRSSNLTELENALNDGFEILRVDTVNHQEGWTFNDYILVKTEKI